MTRVLIVDDHDFFRGSLVDLVDASPDLEAVGECRDGIEVLDAVRRLHPDVVLMDVQMSQRDGLDAAGDLAEARAAARVIMFSSDSRVDTQERARARGAVGFLIKGIDGELLLNAIRRVASGGTAWPEDSATETLLSV